MRNKSVTRVIFLIFIAVVTGENYRWLWSNGGQSVCNDTVVAGITGLNVQVYIGRVHYRDKVYPAYVIPVQKSAAVYLDPVGSGSRKTAISYEVLCGGDFGWLTVSYPDKNASSALPVGFDSQGDPFYACRFVVDVNNRARKELVSGMVDKDQRLCRVVKSQDGYSSVEESNVFDLLIDLNSKNNSNSSSFYSWTWSRDNDDSVCAQNEQLLGGVQGSGVIYLGRVHHFTEIIPAYFTKHVTPSAVYTVGDEVYQTDSFEVLCGTRLVWQQITIDKDNGNETLPKKAFPAGFTSDGDELYFCRTSTINGSPSVIYDQYTSRYNRHGYRDYDSRDSEFIPGLVDPRSLLCNTTSLTSRQVQQNSAYEILTVI